MKNKIIISIFGFTLCCAVFAQTYAARAYVANYGANAITVLDDETRKVQATVTVGNSPTGIAISPDGTSVYVTSESGKNLAIIDPSTNEVTSTITLSGTPHGVVVSPDNLFVYVAINDKSCVEVIDAKQKTSIATVNVGRGPDVIVCSLDGKAVYVTCDQDNSISVFDTEKRELTDSIKVYGPPQAMTMLGNGSLALTVRWLNGYALINPKDKKIGTGWIKPEFYKPGDPKKPFPPEGMFSSGIGGFQSGHVALWLNPGSKLMYDIDTAKDNYIVGFTPTGLGPWGVGVSPDGKTAYVSNSDEDSVSIIDLVNHLPAAKVVVGKNPRCLVVGRVRVSK